MRAVGWREPAPAWRGSDVARSRRADHDAVRHPRARVPLYGVFALPTMMSAYRSNLKLEFGFASWRVPVRVIPPTRVR